MNCSACGSANPVVVSLPAEYREHAPDSAAVVGICGACLTIDPVDSAPDGAETPDFSRISDAFPRRPAQAIPLALAIDLCDSLATNRRAIELLLEAAERAGADPLLVIDRLLADPDVEPAVELDRRRHQLEQLLY
jgi:hypothetical protein